MTAGWRVTCNQLMPADDCPGVSATGNLAQAFAGSNAASSIESLAEYDLRELIHAHSLVADMYQNDPLLGNAAAQTLQTIKYLNTALNDDEREALDEGLSGYPDDWPAEELSRSLQTVSTLIKMGAGTRMFNVDYGGWDTHEHQPHIFAELVSGLSQSLAAFYNDIEKHHQNVTVVVMSEFGRRLRANRSNGTDHGHGNLMMVLGGKVKGGKHYGSWPGLHPDALDKGVDLAVTTDYRNVLANVLHSQMGLTDTNAVFPGFGGFSNVGLV